MKMNIQVNGETFLVTLEHNKAVDELAALLKQGSITLHLNDYAGFEKVGSLGYSLSANDKQTTTHAGDIVLYQGNQIVIFYGSNAWSYTRLGRVDDLSGWKEALGRKDVQVTLTLAN